MEIMTIPEAAKYLGMSVSKFKQISKDIKRIKLGRLVKFDVEDLNDYLRSKKVGGENGTETR